MYRYTYVVSNSLPLNCSLFGFSQLFLDYHVQLFVALGPNRK